VRLGIGFPHQVIGTDPAAVADFAGIGLGLIVDDLADRRRPKR
jgi:hypothetical protein